MGGSRALQTALEFIYKKKLFEKSQRTRKINKNFDLLPKLLNYGAGPIKKIWINLHGVKLIWFYCFGFEMNFWSCTDVLDDAHDENDTENHNFHLFGRRFSLFIAKFSWDLIWNVHVPVFRYHFVQFVFALGFYKLSFTIPLLSVVIKVVNLIEKKNSTGGKGKSFGGKFCWAVWLGNLLTIRGAIKWDFRSKDKKTDIPTFRRVTILAHLSFSMKIIFH